jgi:hypothetical protein
MERHLESRQNGGAAVAIHGDDESRKRILSKTAFKQPIQVLTDGKEIAIIEPRAAAAILK